MEQTQAAAIAGQILATILLVGGPSLIVFSVEAAILSAPWRASAFGIAGGCWTISVVMMLRNAQI
jgi:hypothetical protein